MYLYVHTKDVSVDYPIIKWLPEIPQETKAFFLSSGINLDVGACVHPAHDLVRPGIFLKSTGDQWGVLVTGINSGRRDFTNAQIMTIFVITGTKEEGSQLFGFLEKVVMEVLGDVIPTEDGIGTSKCLIEILLKHLPQGRPRSLSEAYYKNGTDIKTEIEALLSDFTKIASTRNDIFSNRSFVGGVNNPESLSNFLALCRRLLCGEKGIATSLYFLTKEDFTSSSKPSEVALLMKERLLGVLLNELTSQDFKLMFLTGGNASSIEVLNSLHDQPNDRIENEPQRPSFFVRARKCIAQGLRLIALGVEKMANFLDNTERSMR